VGDAVSTVEIPDTSVGLLIVDGELREVLSRPRGVRKYSEMRWSS